MLSPLQLELTKLIGKKEYILISQWIDIFRTINLEQAENMMNEWNEKWRKYCEECAEINEKPADNEISMDCIDTTPATLSDFHRYLNKKHSWWMQNENRIFVIEMNKWIPYDSSKDLLDQDEETLKQIVELVKSNL